MAKMMPLPRHVGRSALERGGVGDEDGRSASASRCEIRAARGAAQR